MLLIKIKISLLLAISLMQVVTGQEKEPKYLDSLSNEQETPEKITLLIKRGKGAYGSIVKWPVSLLEAEKYRELGLIKASKYINQNKLGKLDKNEYSLIEYDTGKEGLLFVGPYYFYFYADDPINLEIILEGDAWNLKVCGGTAEIYAGFESDSPRLFPPWEESLVLHSENDCPPDKPVVGYRKVELQKPID